ncbi:hypothetical protein N7468_003264 [Penicillium chermesinum]|uniref:Branched-chain-amino-acid aminotransferase n=1 Tax=Penicillium chermesinum TaxID=63820 RepID=A0A9W9TRF9_9EURO|nr:uncharacterized protein N7468_003264 [Penicillium chermesinum]KAJ5238645.1 hypothetical protein N7468_003264 [Penicillium chermesinum]
MKPFRQLARRQALSGLATPRILSSQIAATSRLRLRNFSSTASVAQLAALDPSKLTVTKTQSPKKLTPPNELVFGKTFTDHMVSVEWTATEGWHSPRIIPYQNLSLDPSTCVFHYAFECFEGMKAYKDKNGGTRLFRPNKNMERLNKSSARIALPTVDGDALTKVIGEFVKLDDRFIPDRPLVLVPPGSALLFVIASPVGPYYPTGFKAISLEATDYAVRAWPGGVGDKKLGANYAPCILPQLEAASRGFQQNLWLFGEEEYVTEVGTMNLFVALKNKETGKKELITAPLDGTILEGVTRDSVLALARERLEPKGWTISERKIRMSEVAEASQEGRMIEVFGAGTAAIVSPVRSISYRGKLVDCGLKENEEAGEIALQMKNWIEDIQYGDEPHPWSYVV